jgi:hypothetical protein
MKITARFVNTKPRHVFIFSLTMISLMMMSCIEFDVKK